jgi:hypothetical protein
MALPWILLALKLLGFKHSSYKIHLNIFDIPNRLMNQSLGTAYLSVRCLHIPVKQ